MKQEFLTKPEFLTIPEAAEKLKVHKNTIRKLIKEKQLSVVRVGKQIRIVDTELEKISDSKKQKAATALQTAGYSASDTAKIITALDDII